MNASRHIAARTGQGARFWRITLLKLIVFPLVVYACYAGALYFRQTAILFPGATTTYRAMRSPLPADAQLVELPASFGRVRAVFWPARGGNGAAAIYTHGNFETIEDSFAMMPSLQAQGIAVLQLEYPGYGGADGAPTFDSINEAMRAAYDWLVDAPGVDRIVAIGFSIGGGAACELTRARDVNALVLMSPFTAIADYARERWLPAFLVRVPYDNVACVRAFDGPVLLTHGKYDTIIDPRSSATIAKANARTTLVSLDCGHNDCDLAKDVFEARIPQWLRELNAPATPVAH
jgi:uncharacterized protein